MIDILINEIVKEYVGCTYDENTKVVSFRYDDYMTVGLLVSLSDILQKHNISFMVLDGVNVQILDFCD